MDDGRWTTATNILVQTARLHIALPILCITPYDKMLAPRKTLWSTPDAVIDRVIQLLPLSSKDIVCDIGCGDGRCLIRWATFYSAGLKQQQQKAKDLKVDAQEATVPCFVGIDIDEERIRQAMEMLKQAQSQGRIHPSILVSFHCANALEAAHLFQNATVFFLYLIPRGLRILKPLILSSKLSSLMNPESTTIDQNKNGGREPQLVGTQTLSTNNHQTNSIRVATYMSPLPDENAILQERIHVDHHGDGAAWPIYVYEFR